MTENLNNQTDIEIFKSKCNTFAFYSALAIASLLIFNFFTLGGANGTCMAPTQPDKCIIGRYNPLGENNYERMDIVLFDSKNYSKDPSKEPANYQYAKRIIGLPGETVTIKNDKVFINGKELENKYNIYKNPYVIDKEFVLADDEYFLMGDNQKVSYDSVSFGPVKKEDITGYCIYPAFLNKLLGYEDGI